MIHKPRGEEPSILLLLLLLGKAPTWDYANVIASQGLILLTLQIINRSIDQLEMMFTEYIWGFNHI